MSVVKFRVRFISVPCFVLSSWVSRSVWQSREIFDHLVFKITNLNVSRLGL